MVFIAATPTDIVVAADSLRTNEKGVADDRACKIKVGRNGAFVATGSYPMTLLEAVWSLGEQLTNQPGTAVNHLDAMNAFFSTVSIPESFDQERLGAIAFVEMTTDGPFVAGERLGSKAGRLAFVSNPMDWRGKGFGAGYYVLYNETIALSDKDITDALTVRHGLPDLIGLSLRVIGSQAKIDRTVGGSIDVVSIDRSGTQWRQCKGGCGQSCPR